MNAACCRTHDRMDLVLTSEEYHDFPCGTPTSPRGEPRFCCRQCPAHAQPLTVKKEWAANPVLMGFLLPEERAQVIALAVAAGPTVVDIVAAVPPPPPNAAPEPSQA